MTSSPPSSQSMIAPLRKVIVKRPEEAFGSAEAIAGQWESLGYLGRPDLAAASAEHRRLVEILEATGAEVLCLPADPRTGLDSIYTHDPALATDDGVVIFQTGKEARRGEGPALADALERWEIPILGVVSGEATVEGGDLLWLDRHTLAVGRGFRTNAAGIDTLRGQLGPLGVEVLEMQLPYWHGPGEVLHLQSVISLVREDLAVVHRRLLPVPLFERLQERRVELIVIPEEEFFSQACNVLALAPGHVVMLAGNPKTREMLAAAGCRIEELDGREISLKGSGGPTCLTRPVLRGEGA